MLRLKIFAVSGFEYFTQLGELFDRCIVEVNKFRGFYFRRWTLTVKTVKISLPQKFRVLRYNHDCMNAGIIASWHASVKSCTSQDVPLLYMFACRIGIETM